LVKGSNCAAYAGLRSAKSLLLLRRPLPRLLSTAPAFLKKSPGKLLLLSSAAGTPSQLISRRPLGCCPGVVPLPGCPRASRNWFTVAVMSPLPLMTRNEELTSPDGDNPTREPSSGCPEEGERLSPLLQPAN